MPVQVISEIDKLTAARTEEDRARAAKELSCICLGDKIQARRNRQAVAEGGRVISVLLKLISPRYAASTQREAIWTLTLLADEPQARRAIKASRSIPRLLKLLNSKSEAVVEAACQLLARLAYDAVRESTARIAHAAPLVDPGRRSSSSSSSSSLLGLARSHCRSLAHQLADTTPHHAAAAAASSFLFLPSARSQTRCTCTCVVC